MTRKKKILERESVTCVVEERYEQLGEMREREKKKCRQKEITRKRCKNVAGTMKLQVLEEVLEKEIVVREMEILPNKKLN